jgi:hypothetical protein
MVCGSFCAPVVGSEGVTGRVFEQVSPLYKGGFGAGEIKAVAPDGEGVMFYSPGAFANQPAGFANLDSFSYFARRSESGWTTRPELPPDILLPYSVYRDVSSSLDTTLALGQPGPNSEAAAFEGTQEEFRLHSTEASDESSNWSLVGKPLTTIPIGPFVLTYAGADGGLCHLLFANSLGTLAPLLPEAEGTVHQMYELVRGCGGEAPALRLVAINSSGKPMNTKCIVNLGNLDYNFNSRSAFNAVAAGGHEIFFTTCIGDDVSRHQLFVRLDGAKTLEVSKLLTECVGEEVPCLPGATTRGNADFAGASEDGSRVFFTTTAKLTTEDSDNSTDLYTAEIGCPGGGSCAAASRRVVSLSMVSHDPNSGEAADVQGVMRVAPDGSRVYFVARGDLLSEAERAALQGEGRAIPMSGADNLYVYDVGSARIGFVGDLCSGHEESGGAADPECPSVGSDESLWSGESSEAQSAGSDGRYLVFTSFGRLVKSDTDSAADVYRFDAVSGSLVRVSGGEAGYDSDGNNDLFQARIRLGHRGGTVAAQYEMDSRAVSEDGSRTVFETAEPLSPLATNGLTDAYEWHEAEAGGGRVSLLSGGQGETPVEDVVIAPAGRDVFFVTSEDLAPQDSDGLPDVYDARLGGGFQQQPAAREPCAGDTCQGPLTNPAPMLVPGSVSQIEEAAPKTISPPKKNSAKGKRGKRKRTSKASRKAGRRARRASGGHRLDGRRRGR